MIQLQKKMVHIVTLNFLYFFIHMINLSLFIKINPWHIDSIQIRCRSTNRLHISVQRVSCIESNALLKCHSFDYPQYNYAALHVRFLWMMARMFFAPYRWHYCYQLPRCTSVRTDTYTSSFDDVVARYGFLTLVWRINTISMAYCQTAVSSVRQHDCNIISALAIEILQSCSKSSISWMRKITWL